MLRIATHIEKLLLVHDCVIVPGVGGFVLQTIPSTYRKEEHAFSPMRKEVVFNQALQHNDGLLPESYMQSYQADFKKAQTLVDEDIAELKATLQQYNKVSLGRIGSLSKGDEGQFIFQPGKADFFDMDSYGLSSFYFPVLPIVIEQEEAIAINKEKRRKEILYLPVSMRFVRGVVAAVAAIALFLLVSTPVEDVKQSTYTASMIPSEILMPKTSTPATEVEDTKEAVAEISIPAPEVKAPTAVRKKMYHIIIGSFPSEDKATEYLAKIDRTEYQEAGLVVREDRFRIYARKFDNREEAESYLSVIRQTDKHKDAWLFIGR